ncbi:hypothetical protein ANTPLA_LOCUS6796 [Anthophora plagiata]
MCTQVDKSKLTSKVDYSLLSRHTLYILYAKFQRQRFQQEKKKSRKEAEQEHVSTVHTYSAGTRSRVLVPLQRYRANPESRVEQNARARLCCTVFIVSRRTLSFLKREIDVSGLGVVSIRCSYDPPSKSREEYSSLFAYHENVTLCSYVPKKEKAVILLSTMHTGNVVSGPKRKPEIIDFYNRTKSGVDTMDQLLGKYTTKRRTLRWPLALFYNIIDIASLASYIIYKSNNSMLCKKTNDRRIFLRQLGEDLCIPNIQNRASNIQIMRHFATKLAIDSVLNPSHRVKIPSSSAQPSSSSLDASGRKRVVGSCYICHADHIKKRRKTRKRCQKCTQPVCDEHANTITICKNCPLNI